VRYSNQIGNFTALVYGGQRDKIEYYRITQEYNSGGEIIYTLTANQQGVFSAKSLREIILAWQAGQILYVPKLGKPVTHQWAANYRKVYQETIQKK